MSIYGRNAKSGKISAKSINEAVKRTEKIP